MIEQQETTAWQDLPLREAYQFGIEHGLEAEIAMIRENEIEWDRSYTTTVKRGAIVYLFDENGLFDEFKNTCWPNGNTLDGERRIRRYRRIKQEYDDFLKGRPTEDIEEAEELAAEQEFAQEADLRDFLAKNLSVIEPGLRLYEELRSGEGIEYSIDGGRIDILAKDREDNFVVIELKVSRGRNRTIGQLLYYMGWIDKRLVKSGKCRGIIIAKEISDDLRLACERVKGVSLYKYTLSVMTEKVFSN